MLRDRRARPAPRAFAALLLLFAATLACPPGPVRAQSMDDLQGSPPERLIEPRQTSGRGAVGRARSARVTSPTDSIWVGHSIQVRNALDHTTFSYGPYHVGVGLNRPRSAGSAAENSGVWDWDHFQAGESDSLQGWWPMRRAYSITGALTIADFDRPWWAVDIGNQGNYVLNGANGRTFGVVSYWHVDGGTDYTNVAANVYGAAGVKHTIAGTNPTDPGWAPLDGHGSAWCGLRAHGDVTWIDPNTGNPYNAMVLELNGETGGGVTSVGTSKKFPGYPSQMDQMLYRDVEMTSSSATLDLSFLYRTAMSTGATTTASSRTGWFQFDPTLVGPVAVPGPNAGIPNYIGNTGSGQPADSFMVYIGVPVDVDDVALADGTHRIAAPPQHGVYDLRRRWFSEVLALDKPIVEVLHAAGTVTSSFALPGQALAAFYAAQGGTHRYLRIVLRCKTNRGFDDQSGSTSGAYSSAGVGAVLVDDVMIGGTGLAGGALGTSAFESPTEIDNDGTTEPLAMGAWHATGRPPAVFFHAHPLAGGAIGTGDVYDALTYMDACGPPGSAVRHCNMSGVVISAGDHDHGEAAGGLAAGSPERERMDGILSPTILMASTGSGDYNACGIDRDAATVYDDYYACFDIYTGALDLFFSANAYTFGAQSYPARQSDGVLCWGEIRVAGFQLFDPDVRCLQAQEGLLQNGLVKTINPSNRPDSLRIFLGKNQQCFRFGVTGGGCSSKAGIYFDDVSLLLSDAIPSGSAGGGPYVDIWRWINDTFPANDNTSVYPGVAVAPGTAGFDTTAAYIKTGINIAQSPGDAGRFDIPGDSTIVIAEIGFAQGDRLDMVFRIKPGVGNYHVVGDPASGLRPVPTDPVHVVSAGDNTFWGQFLASPGTMSKGAHGPGSFWNRNVWNSARIDTADVNIFPVTSNLGLFDVGANFRNTATWMATYHESDPKYAVLGIPHSICFIVNPAGLVNSTNITCAGPPPGVYGAGQGYDGVPTTKEGTKIIPDGQLTPGAHVEYFFRGQGDYARDDVNFYIVPDTSIVSPQNDEGSTDGHRWQQFGVLPDRWKDPLMHDTPPGTGMACMLYVDLDDRRGDERAWVSLTDSLGLTQSAKRGAHNGWRARGDQAYTDGGGSPIDISRDATIARYDHGGQPGSVWDMYGVKASESLTTGSGQLGGRMGAKATGLATGKDAKFGPTPAMLRTYYQALVLLTGDLSSGVLGRFVNRGADDVALLRDFMTDPAPGTAATTRRVVYIAGNGFVQSEAATGATGTFSDHSDLLRDYLGVTIKRGGGGFPQVAYQPWSGNFAEYVPVTTNDAGPLAGTIVSVGNDCLWGNDVLDVAPNGLNAIASSFYQNVGPNGPYIAGVFTPVQSGKFYASFVDGWDIQELFSSVDGSSLGRLAYFLKVFASMQGVTGCSLLGTCMCALDVPGSTGLPFVEFMRLMNNPLVIGGATVRFGLAHTDRVTARVFDVSGRRVRLLADRNFPPGEHDLVWDGADDGGRPLARGVYFTEIRVAGSGFHSARKLTVLR